MSGLLVVGAGGHGKVVADTAEAMGQWEHIAFLDDKYPSVSSIMDWPVIGTLDQALPLQDKFSDLTVAVGNNTRRVELLYFFAKLGFNPVVIAHPRAFVSERAVIEAGSVVLAQAAVNAGAKIGFGSIINTGATVDHNCMLGEGVHLSPGVHLAGEVKIGRYSWLGVGSSVIPAVNIGENVTVGAGAAVIKDIESNIKVVGVPGRVTMRNERFE
ncbi:MAG: acetyltransferase [Thermincola sp.]|jgi:sugar O-acyltransferase (sialic acid O-acetyltransferase NeuD family)|nr:acetyltransferase [Thermincola sp.]MDT3703461.1 acetyltransferase [Thermincola sp.]